MVKLSKSELRLILKKHTHNKTSLFKGVWLSQDNRFSDMFLKLKRIYYYTDDYFDLEIENSLSTGSSIQVWFKEIKLISRSEHTIRIELTKGIVLTIYDNYAGIN